MKKTVAVPSIEESLAVVVDAVCSISLLISPKSLLAVRWPLAVWFALVR
jgi:hypothetical protein